MAAGGDGSLVGKVVVDFACIHLEGTSCGVTEKQFSPLHCFPTRKSAKQCPHIHRWCWRSHDCPGTSPFATWVLATWWIIGLASCHPLPCRLLDRLHVGKGHRNTLLVGAAGGDGDKERFFPRSGACASIMTSASWWSCRNTAPASYKRDEDGTFLVIGTGFG